VSEIKCAPAGRLKEMEIEIKKNENKKKERHKTGKSRRTVQYQNMTILKVQRHELIPFTLSNTTSNEIEHKRPQRLLLAFSVT
jgi:hypothetical protein